MNQRALPTGTKSVSMAIPTALGEVINIRWNLQQLFDTYDQINITFDPKIYWSEVMNTHLPDWPEKEAKLNKLCSELGNLLFTEKPFTFGMYLPYPRLYHAGYLIDDWKLTPKMPQMAKYLCKGTPLNIGDYVVITTKVREVPKARYDQNKQELYDLLKKISESYPIVILGERILEIRKEYVILQQNNTLFCLYDDLINAIPKDRVIDLTKSALSETVSSLAEVQQDCLIMQNALATITVGIGGNFLLATSSEGKHIAFRDDNYAGTPFCDIHCQSAVNSKISKGDWSNFIENIKAII
ncbi:MAG TPA: hypothetical protein VII94_00785 [Candidatus Saccharimonadales bacterium]